MAAVTRDPDIDRQPAQACTRCGEATYVSLYVGEKRVAMCPECVVLERGELARGTREELTPRAR